MDNPSHPGNYTPAFRTLGPCGTRLDKLPYSGRKCCFFSVQIDFIGAKAFRTRQNGAAPIRNARPGTES